MNKQLRVLKPNETTKLLDKLNTIYYMWGLKGFWISDVNLPEKYIYIIDKLQYIIHLISIYFPVSATASFYTQYDLTEKQTSDRLYSVMLPGNILLYVFMLFYKKETQELLYHLAVTLKNHYNDKKLEQEMVKKIKLFSLSVPTFSGIVIVTYGLTSFYRVVTSGENFETTIMPAWPSVHDKSTIAGVMRVLFYFLWFVFCARVLCTSSLLVSMLIAICYQFKTLQNYFYKLDDIFSDESLNQEEKENNYEEAVKLGIHMHALTLWCKKRHQHICKEAFAVEIFVFFSMLMTQLIALLGSGGHHTLGQLATMFFTSITTLLSLGLFMWNGGDITVEASKLSVAMYSSGWQKCYGQSSASVRKLVVNAMRQAQEPVICKTLAVVDFSYTSYVSLVRLPYTLVSVFY